jgi:hypothetical protein
VEPILAGEADYIKGNRVYDLEEIRAMPPMRLFGNAVLSFMTKLPQAIGTFLTRPMAIPQFMSIL